MKPRVTAIVRDGAMIAEACRIGWPEAQGYEVQYDRGSYMTNDWRQAVAVAHVIAHHPSMEPFISTGWGWHVADARRCVGWEAA